MLRQSHNRRRFAVLAASSLTLLLGASHASAGLEWDGGANNGNWSADNNWNPNGVPPSAADTAIVMAGNVQTGTTQNLGNPFELNSLTFNNTAGGFTIAAGNPLRFSGTNPAIVQDDNDNQKVQTPIQLNGNLTVKGAGSGQLWLTGVLSDQPAGTARSLTIDFSGDGACYMEALNSYTGGTTLKSGKLLIGSTRALGTGKLNINGGLIRASTDGNVTITNPVDINAAFKVGEAGINTALNLGGPVKLNGAHEINVQNPLKGKIVNKKLVKESGSELVISGPVTAGAADGLVIKGTAAGAFNDRAGRLDYGGAVVFQGNSANTYRGTVDVVSGTVLVNGQLGSLATPVAAIVVRDKARFMGSGSYFLPQNVMVDVKEGGILRPGNSPGIMEIGGAGLRMEANSWLEMEFDGPLAGEGDGFHDQVRLVDGSLELLGDSQGMWPILDPVVIGATASPVYDQDHIVVHVLSSQVPRVNGATMKFMSWDGLPLSEGAQFSGSDGSEWGISYMGGDGNDVILTYVPEPGLIGLAALAMVPLMGRMRRK